MDQKVSKTTISGIRITADDHAWLKEAAHLTDATIVEVFGKCVQAYRASQPKLDAKVVSMIEARREARDE